MKNLFFLLLLTMFLFTACKTTMPVTSMEDSTSIRIECENKETVKRAVVQVLRMSRARDLFVGLDGPTLNIRAGYYDRELSQYRIEWIAQELREMSGVFRVDIEENKNLIKQSTFISPYPPFAR